MNAVELALVFGRARPGLFLFGFLIPLAVLALIAYGIWELARSRTTNVAPAVAVPAGSARAVLDERFARGEIDAEEYVHRRTLLDGSPVVTPGAPPAATAAPAASPMDEPPTAEQAAAPEDPSSGPVAG